MRTLTILLSLLFFTACGAGISPYARVSAGRIGCPADRIQLHQIERGHGGPQSWVAMCGPVAYACSSSGEPSNPQARIVCSEFGRPRQYAHQRY